MTKTTAYDLANRYTWSELRKMHELLMQKDDSRGVRYALRLVREAGIIRDKWEDSGE